MKRVYATIWPHRRAKNFERKTKIYGETESGRSLRLYRKHNSIHLSYTQSSVHCHIRSLCWWLELLLLLLLLFLLLLLTASRCWLLCVRRAHVCFIQINRNNWRLSLSHSCSLVWFAFNVPSLCGCQFTLPHIIYNFLARVRASQHIFGHVPYTMIQMYKIKCEAAAAASATDEEEEETVCVVIIRSFGVY